jgi:hypothetical protein
MTSVLAVDIMVRSEPRVDGILCRPSPSSLLSVMVVVLL